jgi:colanic acid/amylovoran biosynthesis glycosyltransferase
MKIAHFTNYFPSLSQTFILNQITGLIDRGHDVFVYAEQSENSDVLHTDIKTYNLLAKTVYFGDRETKYPDNFFLIYIKGLFVFIRLLIRKPGVALRTLNLFKYGRRALSLKILYTAAAFTKIDFPVFDVIHAHFGSRGNLVVLLRDLGVISGKIVTTFYGHDVTRAPKRGMSDIYHELFSKGDLILVLSNFMKNQLIELGCPPEKIKIHHLGIDTNRFTVKTQYSQNGFSVNLITIGRLVEKKGIEYAIRAVSEISKTLHGVHYRIIGDGPLRDKLENTIRECNVGNFIELLGPKSQDEVIHILSQADIFIAPSVTAMDGDTEGTPTVLMEAQALGLPVISTLHSGIPEVVEDGESGILVPERDVRLLADQIEKMIKNKKGWAIMGRKGRTKVESEFNINLQNDKLVEMYRGN